MRHWLRKPAERIAFVLIGGGSVALGLCVAFLTDLGIAQHRAESDLEKRIQVVDHLENVETGGAIGRIEITRLGISSIVLEGSDETTLRRGVGHISGTALPGRVGNVGLAGHRDTFFRALRNIRDNDMIVLRTPRGEYRYRVVSKRIVAPSTVEVLVPTQEETVTLVTCFPFHYVGAAPERFIVHAVRTGI
jgi:sortase A